MTTASFAAPVTPPKFRAFDANGDPLAGGKLYVYVADSTTPTDTYPTYDDALAGTNPNTNPVVLDANGEASIFCQASAYKFVLKDADDVTQWTADWVWVGEATANPALSSWVPETFTSFTYISGTSFRLDNEDMTHIYTPGRRIKTTNGGGTVYSTIVSSSYGLQHTTVELVNDSGSLDSDLSAVWYSLIDPANPAHRDPISCVSVIKNGDMTDFDPVAQVTGWTEQIDALAEFATPAFTAKYPGRYLVSAQLEIADSGTDVDFTAYIYVNASPVSQARGRTDDTSSEINTVSLHWLGALAAGDTVSLYVLGSGNTVVKGTSGSRLSVVRVG